MKKERKDEDGPNAFRGYGSSSVNFHFDTASGGSFGPTV